MLVAVVVLVAVGVAAGVAAWAGDDGGGDGGDDDVRTVQPGAPGEDGRELTDDEAAAIEAPVHTATDTAFVQQMILHHGQGLAMAALVADRTERADLPVLAERITATQETEIELLEQWLTDRGEDVPDPAGHAGHVMPGMATADDLARLEQSSGPAFDRLFLELMIAHHAGAVTMVADLYAAGAGLEPQVDGIAREVDADQSIEIGRMEELLATAP